ncbi:site-specific DNA-methyltransferase [Alistipes sp. OttesenSCG-928-B03]|nr:site-specific DNA-methyltransferase [Alistipes sp. OttesenSCG-928-B03]
MNSKLDGGSLDLEKVNLEKLQTVFPDCVIEGKLDLTKLLALLGQYDDNDFEKYKFEWKGKSESLRLAQTRSMGTLRPAPEESVDWDTTQNLYIEGDNLEVLKLLQTAYYRKVKMIYIDPPYNTGNDFVYEDDFADPISKYKEITAQTTKSNPETMGRYHTNWLNMMYPRLRLASNLLSDDGVIFISIDDNEVHNLRKVCDEVFGEENFAGMFPWRKRTAKSDVPFGVSQDYEWTLCYAKSEEFIAGLEGGTRKYFETEDLPGRPWRIHDLTTQRSALERPNSNYTMINPKTGEEYPVNPNRTWAVTLDTFDKYYADNRIVFPGDYDFLNISKPAFRYFKDEDMEKGGDRFGLIPVSTKLPDNIGMTQDGTKEITELFNGKIFSFPKPVNYIKYYLNATTSTSKQEENIILDFFSGSGTTAHAVMQLNAEDSGNRRFIMVQLPEITDVNSEAYQAGLKNICEIGKQRIRLAGAKIKADWEAEQAKKNAGLFAEQEEPQSPPDTGFKVFKLDTSNLKTWDATPVDQDDAEQLELLLDRMNDMVDTIKSDRSDTDMVYEIMLKMGVPLTYSVTPVEIGGKTAYSIGDESLLLVCLQEGLTAEIIERMAEDYLPSKMILSEKCFADDTAMANAHYILKERDIELKLV